MIYGSITMTTVHIIAQCWLSSSLSIMFNNSNGLSSNMPPKYPSMLQFCQFPPFPTSQTHATWMWMDLTIPWLKICFHSVCFPCLKPSSSACCSGRYSNACSNMSLVFISVVITSSYSAWYKFYWKVMWGISLTSHLHNSRWLFPSNLQTNWL